MAIKTVLIDDNGRQGTQVEVNAGEDLQCCRVQDGFDSDANQLWFFEPVAELQDGQLVGQLTDEFPMAGEPVILRFNTSAAILPIVQDLMIIYGNLVKAGL